MNVAHVQQRLQRDCRAFTLVELLVVIAIIGILTSMTLFTLYGVREDARERRAHGQIARIHELLMQQWESYRTRALPVAAFYGNDPQTAMIVNAQRRTAAVRELMRMELPCRKSDLMAPSSDNPAIAAGQTVYLKSSPSLWRAYIRRARQQIIGKHGLAVTDVDAWKNDANWTPVYQEAECLYLILATMRDGDTTGLDFFTEEEIGDADEDGMPEILDPWGVPIYFLRWAPGFLSDIQLGDLEPAQDGSAGTGNGDAFDPLKVDPRWSDGVPNNDPFLLYPLIVSAGRDKTLGLLSDLALPFDPAAPLPYAYDDPYVTNSSSLYVGTTIDATAGDNITNHLLEAR